VLLPFSLLLLQELLLSSAPLLQQVRFPSSADVRSVSFRLPVYAPDSFYPGCSPGYAQ
jgi:hypothetical protein